MVPANPFDCRRCWLADESRWDREQQHALRCTRPSYDGRWTTNPVPPEFVWLGREAVLAFQAHEQAYQDSKTTPYEDWSEGCPGGWLACAFIQSFAPYIRQVGDFALPNPRVDALDPDKDWHLLEAISHYEQHRSLALKELREAQRRGG